MYHENLINDVFVQNSDFFLTCWDFGIHPTYNVILQRTNIHAARPIKTQYADVVCQKHLEFGTYPSEVHIYFPNKCK